MRCDLITTGLGDSDATSQDTSDLQRRRIAKRQVHHGVT